MKKSLLVLRATEQLASVASDRTLNTDSSNRSIEFNDAVIMLCIEMGQGVSGEQKFFWVGSAPECSPSQRARMCCSV